MKKTLSLLTILLLATPTTLLTAAPTNTRSTPQPQAQPTPLTNRDVTDMIKSGLSAAIITAKISSSTNTFDTSPAAMQQLKAAGVPDSVILAMVQQASVATPQPAATTTTTSNSTTTAAEPSQASSLKAALDFGLTEDTPIKLRLSRSLSSGTEKVGDRVDFEVLEAVKVGDVVVVAQGASAIATITEAKAKGRMGRAGKLNVNIDHIQLANGQKAPLRAAKGVQGGGRTGAMTAGIVATSILFFPAAPFFLFMKGKNIEIPKGTEITAYIAADTPLDRSKFTSK